MLLVINDIEGIFDRYVFDRGGVEEWWENF